MKDQIIRRAGALALVLAMVLSLALSMTVPAWADGPDDPDDPSESPTAPADPKPSLDKSALSLKIGGSGVLVSVDWNTKEPPGDATYSWSCSPVGAVDIAPNNGRAVTVTPKEGTVTNGSVKVIVTWDGSSKNVELSCTLNVADADPEPTPSGPVYATGVAFPSDSTIIRARTDKNPWDLAVALTPAGSVLREGDYIEWSIERDRGSNAVDPKYSETTTVPINQITDGSAGRYTVKATLKSTGGSAYREIEVSGIVLTESETSMLVGVSKVLGIDQMYGFAASGSPTDVDWFSSDSSIVSVMPSTGELVAWQTGTATITATKNGYPATCKVTVKEDEDAVAGPFTATTGDPLILSETFSALNQISNKKTKDTADGSSPLSYITNVKVPTSQGTLYYNYNSEANTGAGVGTADRYAEKPTDTMRDLDLLYFVPRQGFTGVAEISFNGWSQSGISFSGVIRVNVTGVNSVSYRGQAGEPVYFLTGDFNAYCRNKTGRDVNYVTFSLPQASQGVLYYNYTSGNGDRVTTTTQFSQSGRYTIDDVCFVPNAAFTGVATISFLGVDTAGKAFNGEVVVNVAPASSAGNTANVYISGEQGKPVTLQNNLFNAACRETIHDTLSYVTFKLPALDEGTLYYNYRSAGSYDSRVTASTRYYYSGVPGISGVTFVPDSNAAGRIAISYTGFGSAGTSFTGTLYVTMGEADRSTVRYFVAKNDHFTFSFDDFNLAGLYQMGVGVDYVEFVPPDTGLGTLYYDYQDENDSNSTLDSSAYYRTPQDSWQRKLDLISFYAGDTAGTVTIPYTAYSAASGTNGSRQSFRGNVVIQVGASTPADITSFCNTSGQVWLSSSSLSNLCRPVMNKSLSYIEITSIPDPEKGHLYLSYAGFGTGTEVKKGDRFYCIGSPSIDQISFIPRAGFIGGTEITYIGYSGDGLEQVSGRIMVNVTRSEVSQHFNDMSGHVWAIDSVDYLWQNNTVEGLGGGRYNPGGSITKGDFTLMLVRAYGLTASGSVSFNDVPAGSYYAEAIRIAALLGVGSSSNGSYYPNIALSRQDAMVMIYNALKASGKTMTNGLAADLSVYHDEEEIAPYARAAMGSLVQMGVVKGVGNDYLRPRSLLSRAETAMLLHTIMTL